MTCPTRVIALWFLLALAGAAQAQNFNTLYNFTEGLDGGFPMAGVIQDSAGNLYGTATYFGGSSNDGVVYAFNTTGETETTLYPFGASNGARPYAPLVRDKAGNLYGTTAFTDERSVGYGTVFKLGANDKEVVLYTFSGGLDGCYPEQGLVIGTSGVFGTTNGCGSSGNGTVFEIDGEGKFTVLHTFGGSPSDGAHPAFGHLTIDKQGNLYGVTDNGGVLNQGALYKLNPASRVFTLLHSFQGGSDGCVPYGSVAQDGAGNLYGTTFGFDCNSQGTIWKANAATGEEAVLHNFAGGTSDGCNPYAGVTLDPKGRLYGVTEMCGASGDGTLYELSAGGKLTLLHSFDGTDGSIPYGEVLLGVGGTLFGTTNQGGAHGGGTVWSCVP